jgi:predicted amidophosphoribosyltransferase
MEPFRPSLSRRLSSIAGSFGKLLTKLKPEAQEVRTQRMCPFCGLITPRAGRFCLECGKPLRTVQVEQRAASQE